jgi:hypothetical protein
VFLAQGRDQRENETAKFLIEHFSKAQRILPDQGQSGSEYWILRIEEKEGERQEREKAEKMSRERTPLLQSKPSMTSSMGR